MLKLILHLIFLLNYTINITYSLNDEGLALLSFKNSIIKDPLGSLTNWNTTDETPCTWNGITCKQDRVTSISIPRKQLYGILSYTLFTLPSLRHVNLRNNALFGNLPPQLYHAQSLQSLVLSDNSLSGSLSNDVGKLQNLVNFDLSNNLFNGSLPVSIVECRKLKYLDLSNNNFSGSLPNGIGNGLVLLQKLDFSKNKFDGSIPSDLGKLSNLEGTLDLSNNSFSGSIPSSLGDLPEEVYIDLSYNNLSGSIPQNGALINRGPTAFIGNPNLCGPPLKSVCSSNSTTISPSSYPNLPSEDPRSDNVGKKNGKVLSRSGLVAIIVCDIVGICLIGWLVSYCYTRFCSGCKSKDEKGIRKKRNDGCCFRKPESETMSENAEQYELVPLDSMVTFDLDELLKATAFVIGKSGVGIMYKVVLEDGLTLAVRRLGEGGSQWFKEFETEVEAIGKIRHPNIVTLRAYYWSVDEKLLIYDYVPNGSLASALHGNPGMASFTPLPWSIRVKIMKGIARGIVYLHEFSPKKYIHGALNPSNILLGPNMEAKIADFGLGRLANIGGGTLTLQRQSQSNTAPSEAGSITTTNAITYYQAPESLKPVKPSQKWDVYSFGVILLEMITGLSPLVQASTTGMDLVQWVQHCIQENKPLVDVLDPYLSQEVDIDDDEDEIVDVLKIAMACVHCLPEKRPPMRHVSDVLERLYESSP